MSKRTDIVIGIDPDVDKSGVAVLDTRKRQFTQVTAEPFPPLLEMLNSIRFGNAFNGLTCRIIIEAGWLNRGNWHLMRGDSRAVIAAKGNHAGRNHEVGRKIAEMCEFWRIPHDDVKPLTKMWRGHDRKITAIELQRITGWSARTNQEMRDAALLAWVWAGLPL